MCDKKYNIFKLCPSMIRRCLIQNLVAFLSPHVLIMFSPLSCPANQLCATAAGRMEVRQKSKGE